MTVNTSLKRKKLLELLWNLRDAEVYFDNTFDREDDLDENVLTNIRNTANSINIFLSKSNWDEVFDDSKK